LPPDPDAFVDAPAREKSIAIRTSPGAPGEIRPSGSMSPGAPGRKRSGQTATAPHLDSTTPGFNAGNRQRIGVFNVGIEGNE